MIQRMLLIAAISVCLAGAGHAADIYRGHIVCGGTVFRAMTKEISDAPIFQQITAQTLHGKRPVPLRERKVAYPHELGHLPGLSFLVVEWQCRTNEEGTFLVLGYECKQDLREDGPEPECNGPNDWERYVALDGTLLDDGYSFNDKRYAALHHRKLPGKLLMFETRLVRQTQCRGDRSFLVLFFKKERGWIPLQGSRFTRLRE